MTHYYFHVTNGSGHIRDDEGRRCEDPDDARRWAIIQLRSLIADDVNKGFVDLDARITIAAGDADSDVATVRFDDAVAMTRQDQSTGS